MLLQRFKGDFVRRYRGWVGEWDQKLLDLKLLQTVIQPCRCLLPYFFYLYLSISLSRVCVSHIIVFRRLWTDAALRRRNIVEWHCQ